MAATERGLDKDGRDHSPLSSIRSEHSSRADSPSVAVTLTEPPPLESHPAPGGSQTCARVHRPLPPAPGDPRARAVTMAMLDSTSRKAQEEAKMMLAGERTRAKAEAGSANRQAGDSGRA